MAELFSQDWMLAFGTEWNNEPDLGPALARIGFSSAIGYGYPDEDQPRGFLQVENGMVSMAGQYGGQELNWDLRASAADWEKWCSRGIGMMALGAAYARGRLKFRLGDYAAMIKNPAMAGPFIKSFSVMGKVARD